MKVTTIIDPDGEEEVIVRTRTPNDLADKIRQLVSGETAELLGFQEDKTFVLDYADVCRFTVEQDKTYARIGGESYRIKQRLYQIEQKAPSGFVKINQSCLANVHHIARFEAAFSGALRVVFKNGDVDYVSRRNLKQVKERIGL